MLVLNMVKRLFGGLGLVLVLSLFFTTASSYAAVDWKAFGPQTYEVHKYYYFGDNDLPALSRNGIDISVDTTSVSYQSVKATVTMDWNIIDDRQITKFIILANGVNVDEFEPYFDRTLDPPTNKEYYYLDVNVSDQYIGSDVYFQVVALKQENRFSNSSNVWVVAWSQESPTVSLKPLPVTDSETHGLLFEIWLKLDEILAKLSQMKNLLDQILYTLENLFVPTPSVKARFDKAVDDFINKTPMKEFQDKMQEMTDANERAKDQLEEAGERIVFGDKVDLIPGEGIYWELDFTEWKTEILVFRTLLNAMLWLSFFYFFVNLLTPKPQV